MAADLRTPTSNRRLISKESNGSMTSGSTAATSSDDSSPVANANAYQERKTAHAEELASRLIAFSQMAQTDAERREREAPANDSGVNTGTSAGGGSTAASASVNVGSFPPLPVSIMKKPSINNSASSFRKNPPPPPPRRHSSVDGDDVDSPLHTRSLSLDASKLEEDQPPVLVKNKSSSIRSEFSNSSASLHNKSSLKDLNNSSMHSVSSRDFNKATTELEPRKVRVTQFNDEPEEQLESSESLPPHCDKKGRCIYHSNIKLYKRHLLGGFSLVLNGCPLCEAANIEVPMGKPTIVIQRSTSVGRGLGRRDRSMERGISAEYVRSTSLERRSSASKVVSPVMRMRPKLSRKVKSATEAGAKVQGVSAFLEDTHIDGSFVERPSPPPRPRPKLSRKATSETETSRAQGDTSFLDNSNTDSMASPTAVRPQLKSNIIKKTMSENDRDTRTQGDTAYLEEHWSNGSPPPQASSMRASMKPKPPRKSMSETDRDIRSQGHSAFVDQNQEADMPTQYGRSGSGSSHNSSPLSTPDTQSFRPKLVGTQEEAPSSILEKGLEKLSVLSRKGRPSSRARGSDNSTIKSLGSRARSENTDVGSLARTRSKSGQKSKRRAWDNTGRCKKHPSIIMARKRPFSNGWDQIRGCCPMCDESESEVSTSMMNHLLGMDKSPAPNEFDTSYHSADPFTSDTQQPRTIAEEPKRSRSRGRQDGSNRSAPRHFNHARAERPPCDMASARVHKMPYSAPWGEKGSYTGEVNDNGKPHGQGKMRTKTGNVVDGLWINGCHEDYVDKQKKMKSGFGSNIAPWKQNEASPHYKANAGSRPSSRPSSRGPQSSNTHQMGMMPQAMSSSPPKQQQQQPYGGQMQQYDYSQHYDQRWQQQGYPQQQQNYPPHQLNYSQQHHNYSQQQYPQQHQQQQYHQQQQQYWQPQQSQDPSMMYGQMPPQQHYR